MELKRSMVTLDTNVLIYYLDNDADVVSLVEPLLVTEPRPFIATVTELEVLSLSRLTSEEKEEIDELLTALVIVPLDSYLARIAAGIRRTIRMKTADSIVAATALFTNSTLLTRNVRDFKKVAGLSVQKI